MTAALEVQALEKSFGTGAAAVDDVSFDIPAGDIVALLGPSGCGKTTTLRCVAGLENPTGGAIRIAGHEVSAPGRSISVPARYRNIGMVFQSYAVWPHMTVRENVEYPLKNRRMAAQERTKRVMEVLELVELAPYADRSAVSLSGGQMQRIALARSLVYQPRLLLLDEPLSNLDAKLRLHLRAELRRIIKSIGVPALYVTHDQSEAVVLGDRVGVMNKGRLLQLASAKDIYNKPADLFVANFTGATNAFKGTLVGREGPHGVVAMADGTQILAGLQQQVAIGDSVVVSVRPENVQLGVAEGPDVYRAKVLGEQYQGTQTSYVLSLFGKELDVVELGTGLRFPVGTEITAKLPRDVSWVFRDASCTVEKP